jgi:hypothetical protein
VGGSLELDGRSVRLYIERRVARLRAYACRIEASRALKVNTLFLTSMIEPAPEPAVASTVTPFLTP